MWSIIGKGINNSYNIWNYNNKFILILQIVLVYFKIWFKINFNELYFVIFNTGI